MMSSSPVSRSVTLPSPIKITKEEASRINIEKQGIPTILGKDLEITQLPPSLRRTLSADMSSKNFLTTNGLFSPMKRIASSEALAPSSSEGDDDQEDLNNIPGHDDIWRAIQSKKEKKEEVINNPTQLTSVWSTILSEKANNEANNLPPPYVHPLLKKSSTLNEKSLEICTESLGSETGSDDFSYPPLETGDAENDKAAATQQQKHQENEPQIENYSFEGIKIAKYNYDPSKKMTPKSFPPPLQSLARKDGPSLHMQSHRKNGRLVLEAVSVPQRNYFQAERQEGRLVLTLVNSPDSHDSSQEEMDDKVANFEEVFGNFEEIEGAHEAETDEDDYVNEEDDEEDEVELEDQENEKQNVMKEMTFFLEQSSSSLPTSGMLNVHRSALIVKSLMGLGNRDYPSWSNKLNKAVELMEEQVVAELTPPPIPQSLPPLPRVARLIPTSSSPPPTMSFNEYEYYWRNNKTTFANQEYTNLKGNNHNNNKVVLEKINHGFETNEQQENMVLEKGNNGDYLVPFIKGCKENRRSILSRQPHCIATS